MTEEKNNKLVEFFKKNKKPLSAIGLILVVIFGVYLAYNLTYGQKSDDEDSSSLDVGETKQSVKYTGRETVTDKRAIEAVNEADEIELRAEK